MDNPVSRRSFVAGIGAATAVSLAQGADRKEILDSMQIDPEAADVIGNLYLEQYPEERDLLRLRLKFASLDARDVGKQVQRDFAAGRIVYVDGWALSRTEARVCAAVALG